MLVVHLTYSFPLIFRGHFCNLTVTVSYKAISWDFILVELFGNKSSQIVATVTNEL